MPKRLTWTAAQDLQIRRMCVEGAAWDSIAAALVVPLCAVIERGRMLRVRCPPAGFAPAEDPARDALPAGHPRSWDTINAGTVLDGQPYPLPFFRR